MSTAPVPQRTVPPGAEDFAARGQRIGIFVIAYNAESHIEQTLARIPEQVWQEITVCFVVDDCSTDDTVNKALNFEAHRDKLVVLRNRVNRRYGGNQKFGYQWALDQGLDVVVMLHADGQYAPEMLAHILNPLVKQDAEVVFGSRMINRADALKGGMPKYKFVGNIVLTRIENAVTGMSLSEFHSGYRAFRTEFLRNVPFWENSDEWHFDTQILLQARQYGARIVEVAIPTYYGDEICRVNGTVYALNCILSSIFFRLHRSGVVYSRKYDVGRKGRRYFDKFDDPYSSHSILWGWIQQGELKGTRVLELGVGDASLTRRLHEAGAIVDGVEIDQASADLAQPYCRRVMIGDLDQLDTIGLDHDYDLVVAADVLEHLVHPEIVLSKLKRHLKRNGRLYVSLPNIANLYVRLNLLLGRFPTHSKGLLDATHLHCYTLDSMRRLLRKTGWVVDQEAVTAIPVAIVFPFLRWGPFRLLPALLFGATRMLRGLLGYQGLFTCHNPNRPDLL